MRIRHGERGMTLIELLVVVAIIGILAATAIPQYKRFLIKTRRTEVILLLDGLQKEETAYYSTKQRYTNDSDDLSFGPTQVSPGGWSFAVLFIYSDPPAYQAQMNNNLDQDGMKDAWLIKSATNIFPAGCPTNIPFLWLDDITNAYQC